MRGIPYTFRTFGAGLNTRDGIYNLNDVQGQNRDCMNVGANIRGSLIRRNGCATFSTAPVQFTSLYAAETSSQLLGVGTDGNFYAVSAGGITTLLTKGAGVTCTAGSRWSFISASPAGGQGPVYGVNGSDPPVQWNGGSTVNTWTADSSGPTPPGPYQSSIPNGTMIKYHQNHTWIAGVSSSPSTLFFSAVYNVGTVGVANPRAFATNGYVILDPDDGEVITALGTVGPYLLVFKKSKIFVITDPATGANRRLGTGIGCIAPRSVVETPNGTFFLTDDKGIWKTNGSKLDRVSILITPTLTALNATARKDSAGVFYNDHYYLTVPISGALDTTLDYDLQLNSWWKHDQPYNQMTVSRLTGTSALYGAKTGRTLVDEVFKKGQTFDNGSTPIVSYWKSPWQSPSYFRRHLIATPYIRKRFRQFRCDGSGSVDFYTAKNFDDTTEALVQSNFLSGTGTIGQGRIFSLGVARAVSIVLRSSYGMGFELDAYTYLITDRTD